MAVKPKQPDTASEEEDEMPTPRASLPSIGDGRLSRISCNTKFAVALNQIDRIAIQHTYERDEDGVTIYVLDVYVRCVQTGIPTVTRRSHSTHSEDGARMTIEDDPVLAKREREEKPHYRMAYRFSEFYELRRQLQEAVTPMDDVLHAKWCRYCSRVDWLVHGAPFPSRCLFDSIVNKMVWMKKLLTKHRARVLTFFLNQVIHGARNLQYRFTEAPCGGFVNVSYILREFLSEPHVRLSSSAW